MNAAAREEQLQRVKGMKIAQMALQSIGMSTKDPRGLPQPLPQYALAVSIIFTKATNQTIILNTSPKYVLSTSILWNSLAHDKRFQQIPMSEAASGDIIIASDPSRADGYAGIIVDHERIVSNSDQGVRNDSSLLEIQCSQPGLVFFRYIGVQGRRSHLIANEGFDPNELRIPAGQPGGGQWSDGLTSVLLGKKDLGVDSLTDVLLGGLGGAANVVGTVFGGPHDIDSITGKPNVSAYTQKVIDPHQLGAALPYVFPHSKNQLPDKWIKITSKKTGKSVVAPIVDVGPHVTNNPYWESSTGDSTSGDKENKAGLDMTPATGAALGLPVSHGSRHNPPAFNTMGDELCDWQFVPNPSKKNKK